MSHYMKYMPGDQVNYIGLKFKTDLFKEGKNFVGWVHAPVGGQDDVYVVEFPETKEQDSYVIHASNLTPHRSNKKSEGPEVAPRRRKRDDDV